MLELREVTKKYNVFPAVDRVSFAVRPGEVLGYLGPNGAGKSTTIKILAGLIEPTSGVIFFGGRDIRKDLLAYKSRLGYVPEQSEIYPHLSGLEYLLLVGRLRGLPEARLLQKARAFLRVFDLDGDRDTAVGAYSKGMRQKILISAALLHDPEILLLDEPLSGLDVTTSLILRDLVRRLAAERKIIIYAGRRRLGPDEHPLQSVHVRRGCGPVLVGKNRVSLDIHDHPGLRRPPGMGRPVSGREGSSESPAASHRAEHALRREIPVLPSLRRPLFGGGQRPVGFRGRLLHAPLDGQFPARALPLYEGPYPLGHGGSSIRFSVLSLYPSGASLAPGGARLPRRRPRPSSRLGRSLRRRDPRRPGRSGHPEKGPGLSRSPTGRPADLPPCLSADVVRVAL
ncbi:MAG: ABC transporter ATP-binding protein [Candidatus Aminicenantes bacterium]|nr:ABC transporter ATP-binding protein [Candidatus Aminicenantes bacterium]